MGKRVVAIIQARIGSTRLPGKVLEDLAGEPMVARVVTRVTRAATVDETVVATTVLPGDDVLADLCAARGWKCSRGSSDDVLDRYHAAAEEFGAEVVVRVTSDCPLIDPDVIDAVVESFAASPGVDYAANTLPPRTFPRGLDVEVMAMQSLEAAWRDDSDAATREHVTPYLYRHPERFQLLAVRNAVDLSAHRWTVDTAEDLDFARHVYAVFAADDFTWHDVLAELHVHPEWAALNQGVRQKDLD